ncbi:hypothetical protein ETD83_31255 [Actinomadura soli]|uniref:Uncharacterized protein n=1 Tax=Actinomadura soli TaxID=2508997 RepID=A0A5C4J4A4_9ACTN|nr:hypothetical protein [Actinomadura soli]TMQ91376.1 hypothetical protein ETD83_31255 [Actinomadura soli]
MRQQSSPEPRKGYVPVVSEYDPLPAQPEPQGRWAEPYLSDKSGMWTVLTRRPLTRGQIHFGLRSIVAAQTLERLRRQMSEQDEKWAEYIATDRSTSDHDG